MLFFPGVIAGIVILLLLSIWAHTRVYTPNNEAFVRTGGIFVKKKTVILNGGCIALPGFHELTRVPLREISIDVERTGKLAVRTQDYLVAIEQKELDAQKRSLQIEEEKEAALLSQRLKVTQAQQQQEAEIAEIGRQQQVEANRLQAQVAIAQQRFIPLLRPTVIKRLLKQKG